VQGLVSNRRLQRKERREQEREQLYQDWVSGRVLVSSAESRKEEKEIKSCMRKKQGRLINTKVRFQYSETPFPNAPPNLRK